MAAVKRIKLSKCEPETVNDNVIDFSMKSETTDCALVVEEKKLYVSKLILGLTSPVLKQMFNSDFKEKNQDEIDLPDKKYADVLEFLKCVYPGVMKPVSMDTVFDVLPLADEYLVDYLKEQCQQVLLAYTADKPISVKDLCNYLQVSSQYKLEEFKEKCVKAAGNHPGSIFSTEADKFNLPVDVQAAIYKDICIKQSQVLRNVKTYRRGCDNDSLGKQLAVIIDNILGQ